ncbi:anaerobic C4-dicarboxylate transporter [Roseospira marina]|uniref:C4-dicarboxylate transporter n=1 Tax=Roseospira marina TaxID=140057 RepID=A0A5M6I9X4_9PROT|nr:anaerobic C4-dicarboxylate transporter [Roseospira marina]KAA5605050.1 anaerobic C4-dicarboxylate transporter [Roseospira marina]MBB4314939.1 anaerobic C4-dicarboxylate transporter DcuB [Roseospira marina]MBB5087939.1 anaerobic C4-dicarboxylate transporter DcuB [Roseospira marina]
MIWVQLAITLLALYIGARIGGLGMGITGGLGVVILCFGFGLVPGDPPISVMLIILAAVTAASALEAARGMEWLVQLSERLLRQFPKAVTFLGPLVTYTMTLCVGTGHTVYVVQPIIADVARKTGIRPERPLAVASVGSQLGITASPLSAAIAWLVTEFESRGVPYTLGDVLMVTILATLVGLLTAAMVQTFVGKELDQDPEYQRRLADPALRAEMEGGDASLLGRELPASAKRAVVIFLLGLVCIVILGMFPELRPVADPETGRPVGMGDIIQMALLTTAAAIVLVSRVNAKTMVAGPVFRAGMSAVVAIFGIAWLADTFVTNNLDTIRPAVEGMVRENQWMFAFAFFLVSIIVNSQAATARMLGPLAFQLGVAPATLIGIYPSVYAYYFIPNYPSDLATVNFDRTGTTRIGRFLLNHSFMLPGLICTWVSVTVGLVLASVLL